MFAGVGLNRGFRFRHHDTASAVKELVASP